MAKGNQESTTSLNKKRYIKLLLIIVAGVIIHTAIILVLYLTVMKIRTPKVRLGDVKVETLTLNSTMPSFSMKLDAQVTVKNMNFGHFKFHDSTAAISYRGTPVGEGIIGKARAKARSTKKLNVTLLVSSERNSNMGGDIKSEKITLTALATLSGKVHLFKIIKKKKSADMDCTMDVNTKTHEIQNLSCK